jgi:hypothetical protein
MIVTFENATINGAITTASTKSLAEGLTMDDSDYYYLIGQVVHTYGPPESSDAYGMVVTFDESSKWMVTKTSYLTSLNIAEGAAITAAPCSSVNMTVDGVETVIEPGLYEGDIVITVTETAECPGNFPTLPPLPPLPYDNNF